MISVYCSLVVTCLERNDLLALFCVMFSCAFVTFPYGVLSQVLYLIVFIPGICLLSYFVTGRKLQIDKQADIAAQTYSTRNRSQAI